MAIYIYDYHDERGEFHAYVRDEAGNIAWEVHYPEYLEDDETGELLEGSTIFEDGYLKNADDLEGLYYYLLDFGAIEEDDEVVKLEDYEKMQEQKDDLLDFAIPKWAMSAIVNGDTSGLEDEDIIKLENFQNRLVELYGNANLMLGDVDGEDDLGFRYRNDIDGNLGADCSRMYLRPTKSYEDGGALMDGQYGFGTSYLAKGGSLEDRIKKRLGENFELPIELAVYVPSTEKANQVVSKRDYAYRIDEVRSYLANLFGGYSSEGIDGGYVSEEKGLIQEDVTKVTAFATKENFEQKLESLVTQIKKWCGQWGQESIGFEFEGDLFYISKDGKFMDGGAIPEGYHMMPDGTIMPDSAHMDKGGKVDDEDEEDKEQEHLEYVSEETNIPIDVLKEYASNKGIEIEDLDTDLGYQGSYVNEEAFAQYCADEGLINDLSYYLEMYDTDKRILVDEMSDNYVDDLSDDDILSQSSYEDEAEKLKEAEANLSIQEGQLDDLKDERQDFIDSQEVESMTESDREDMDKALDEFDEKIKELEDTIEATNDDISDYDDYDFILEKAKDEVRAIYYDDLLDRLNKDAVGYFVDELGYEQKDLVDKNGFFIDLGLLARDLGNDYDFIEYEGEVYVFSSYYKYGGGIDLGSSFEKFKKSLNIIPNEVQSQIKDNEVLNMAMESVGDAWEDLTDAERELIVNSFREGYKKGNYAKGGEFEVDPTYTHFAVGKRDGKIVTGWEYKDLDKESIKYYTKVDLVDMDFKPSDFRILTTKYLKAQGVDPFNWDNWRKHNHYAHGGSVAEGNLEMLKNQAKEFKHHAEELGEVVDKNPRVDAWVVAKAERATSDLSDITHYLEGQEDGESFKDGGEITDKDYTSIVKLVKGINPNVYTRVFKGNKVLVSLNEYSKNGLSYLRDSINEVLPNYSIRIGEGGVTEGMIIIEKDKMEDGGVTPKVFEKVKITIRDVDMGGDVIYKNDHWINKKALDEKSSSDIGKYILNKYGLDYGNTYKFSLKRTGETKEKDKKSIGGFIAGVAVGAIGSKLLSKDGKETSKPKGDEKEMTWQEELKVYEDKEGFDYAINEYSGDVEDKKFIELKNKYIRESDKIKKYIDSKKEIYDSKYDITVQDAVDKEGIDYALMGYNDWKGVKDKKFQDLLKEYLQSRKALSKYIGIGTQMARGGELKEEISNEYQIISSEEFNKKYVDDNLKKAYFGNEFEEDIVTDINHYGEGQYWCASENCIEHYRENPNYIDEDETQLPPGLKIAIGNEDTFYDYENEIRKNADGFYNPEMDTFGLILFYKKLKEDESLHKWFSRKGGSIDDLDEIKKGDYVNFGEYGNFYVVDTDYLIDGTHFWVTRDKENRTNSQAPGYTILKGDAQYIIEKYSNDDDFAKGGEVEKKEYINKYIKDLGLDVEEMPARQYRYLSKQASRKYEKEKLEKMPYRKYRVSYRIPFGAIHSTIVDARTSNEARTIFRKTHGRDIQGNQDKILSVTLTKVKKEQGGMMASGGWMDDVEREMNELKKKYPKAKVTYFFAKNPNGKNYVIEVKEGNKVIYTSYGGNKMAKGGETKFISLTTRKGQSEVEKYTNQGWGIKFQNDKFAILERGGKKKN